MGACVLEVRCRPRTEGKRPIYHYPDLAETITDCHQSSLPGTKTSWCVNNLLTSTCYPWWINILFCIVRIGFEHLDDIVDIYHLDSEFLFQRLLCFFFFRKLLLFISTVLQSIYKENSVVSIFLGNLITTPSSELLTNNSDSFSRLVCSWRYV
jgi:hypothetical protein